MLERMKKMKAENQNSEEEKREKIGENLLKKRSNPENVKSLMIKQEGWDRITTTIHI